MFKVKGTLPMLNKIKFKIEIKPEFMPIKGNLIASGCDKFDKLEEDKVIERLDNGEIYAWCIIIVKAFIDDVEAEAYLGGVSCKDWNEVNRIAKDYGLFEEAACNLMNEIKEYNEFKN